MAWMMDTYSMQVGHAVPGDRHRQADLDRRLALPARGDRRRRRDGDRAGVRAARLERSPSSAASSRASATSAASPRPSSTPSAPTVIAVSDVSGGVYDPGGLDVEALLRASPSSTARSPTGHEADRLTNEELLELPCDILVLAAREDQVTRRERGPRVQARAGRRGRERADLARGRRDPRRARDPRPARRAHERRRRHRLVLRVGAGPRPPVLGTAARSARSSPTSSATRSSGSGRSQRAEGPVAAQRRARGRDPRGRRRARRRGDLSVSRVRDAMIPDPVALDASATAQEAGEHLVQPDVRAVYVCDDEPLRRRGDAQDARASRSSPQGATRGTTPVGELAEPPNWTIDPELAARRGLPLASRSGTPSACRWSTDGRLVGVLSRSVLQRRLAEDEPPGRAGSLLAAGVGAGRRVALFGLGQLRRRRAPRRAGGRAR